MFEQYMYLEYFQFSSSVEQHIMSKVSEERFQLQILDTDFVGGLEVILSIALM